MNDKKIIVGFDFFDSTENAVSIASSLSRLFDCTLIPVHAIDYVPYHYGLNYWNKIYDEIYPRMKAAVDKMTEIGAKVDFPVIAEGRPYDVLLKAADDHDVGMIVVGQCRTRILDRVSGTTCKKLIRNARQPVMVLKHQATVPGIRRILCAIDFSLTSNTVLSLAILLAARINCQLDIINVAPEPRRYPGISKVDYQVISMDYGPELKENLFSEPGTGNCIVGEKLESVFNNYLTTFDLTGIRYSSWFRYGVPSKEILRTTQSGDYDLLIIGTKGQNNVSRISLGNTAEKIINDSPCSLIVVPYSELLSTLELGGRRSGAIKTLVQRI